MAEVFGYARVSTDDQVLDMQIDALKKYGVDRMFVEKVSGKKTDRPQLNKMLEHLRSGDTVVIYKLDRIGRNRKHLFELVDLFKEKNVNFVSLQDQIDTSTAVGNMFFGMMAVLAQFEADLISERTKAGLESARSRGKKGGRPKKSDKAIERALKMYDSKEFSIPEIIESTGVAKTTLYRYINERKEKQNE
ncbi:recombinase family protein [Bacillus infantis]|uniref:Recombinase family protein n=1 Tax=Bacillus infantis TaxID=324767 RepID=A0A5D4RWR6_9BACI|nr:recombinase family protein [Bacillus infantis]TYS55757.1 recombinase family protein [Bacillus infantis]